VCRKAWRFESSPGHHKISHKFFVLRVLISRGA
jgi:hypothetical protein